MSEFSKCVLLSGYGFDADGPHLVLDDVDARPWRRRRFHLLGRTLTISRHVERDCTGRYEERTLNGLPCPDRASLHDADSLTCAACRHARGFNPAFYNAGARISPQQRRYNAEPHSVYLAHFGAQTIKIGIANCRRERARLLEQGARLAAVVSRCADAYEARRIEQSGVERLGLAEVVRGALKRRLLEAPFRADAAKAELWAIADRLAQIAESKALELLELDAAYGLSGGSAGVLIDAMEAEPFLISGTVRAVVGEFLIVEQAAQRFVVSLRKLTSHRIAIDSGEVPVAGPAQTTFSF